MEVTSSIILGLISTFSALFGVITNWLTIMYIQKKTEISKTALDLVRNDATMGTIVVLLVHYFIYILGLTIGPLDVLSQNFINFLDIIYYVSLQCFMVEYFNVLIVRYMHMMHGDILFEASDTLVRKISFIASFVLLLLYCLIDNVGINQKETIVQTTFNKENEA